MPRPSICFILLVTAAVGCHTNIPIPSGGWFKRTSPPMILNGTRAEMRAEVLRHIPPGTSLEDARVVLEHNGFVCRDSDDGSPTALVCTKRPRGGGGMAYEWRVELFHDGAKVTGVDAAMLGYGPEETKPPAAEPEN